MNRQRLDLGETYVLHPGAFLLASTLEFIRLPRDIAGRLEGRSSLGRLGLQVHATAGFVDPGFEGVLTFELINSGKLPVRVFPGMRLGQICFFHLRDVEAPYRKKLNKYAGGLGVLFTQIEDDPEILWECPDAAADSLTNEESSATLSALAKRPNSGLENRPCRA